MPHEYRLAVRFKSPILGLEKEELEIPWQKGRVDRVRLSAKRLELVMCRASRMASEGDPLSNQIVGRQLVKGLEYVSLRYGAVPSVSRDIDNCVDGVQRRLSAPQASTWERSGSAPRYDGTFLKTVLLPILSKEESDSDIQAVRNALGYVCAGMRLESSVEERFRVTFSAWNVLYRVNAAHHVEDIKGDGCQHKTLVMDIGSYDCGLRELNRLGESCGSTEEYVRGFKWNKPIRGSRNSENWFQDEEMPPDRVITESVLRDLEAIRRGAEGRGRDAERARRAADRFDGMRKALESRLREGLPVDADCELRCILRYYVYQLRNATVHGEKWPNPFIMGAGDPDRYEDVTGLLRHAIKDAVLCLMKQADANASGGAVE